MPRTMQITIPSERTDQLVDEIKAVKGLLSLRVQRNISVQPPGDVLSLEVTSEGLHRLMALLDQSNVGKDNATSITTSNPASIVSASSIEAIALDESEATWEEMEVMLGEDSNMTVNAMTVMAVSGVLATIGLATNALHIVIAAMVIAPGFEPITRIGLGIVSRSRAWRRGLAHTVKGYLAFAAGTALATLVLVALGQNPLGGESSYFPPAVLITYWTTITASSLLVSVVASIAGVLLIATRRAVLTAGVMLALALVPSAAITTIALIMGDPLLSLRGAIRFLAEAIIIGLLSVVVFYWKRPRVGRRRLML